MFEFQRFIIALSCLILWSGVVTEGASAAGGRLDISPMTEGMQDIGMHVPKDLQSMIDHARAGDVLELEAGVYKGPVRIDKPLHMIGKGNAVVDGSGRGPVIQVDADGVRLEGLVIRNSGRRSKEDKAGVLLRGSRCRVAYNRFEECVIGILLSGARGNQIVGNQMDGFPDKAVHLRGHAIELDRSHGNRIENNRIDGFLDGVYVERSAANRLVNNCITRSRYGFHFMIRADRNEVHRNEVAESLIGVLVMDSDQIRITGNFLHGNRSFQGYGAVLYGTRDTVVQNNLIADNGTGLMLEKSTNNLLRENTVIGNQLGLEVKTGTANNRIVRNNFVANQFQVRQAGNWANPLDDGREGNFWDDYSGMDGNGDGVGDVPHVMQLWFAVLTERFPAMALYAHSPAVAALMSAPVGGEGEPMDGHPLVQPVQWEEPEQRPPQWRDVILFGCIFLLGVLGFITGMRKGRAM